LKPALQIYFHEFDADFFKLPKDIQTRIESSIDRLGRNIDAHAHYRMTGVPAFRLRIGDYRVLYEIDRSKRILYLLSVGHRREVYRPR
jgi:mRNA interferase RelE/StbE